VKGYPEMACGMRLADLIGAAPADVCPLPLHVRADPGLEDQGFDGDPTLAAGSGPRRSPTAHHAREAFGEAFYRQWS
jgi:hypothetical protein